MIKGKFIRISHEFFNNSGIDNIFTKIGTKGFLLYTYLLYKQSNNSSCEVSLKMIQTFLNRDYDNRPEIPYSKNKKCKIELMKDKKTIVKSLEVLQNNNLIKILNNIGKINDIMIIECTTMNNDLFVAMPEKLFIDNIHRIGHIGWSCLCLLSKLFNQGFGGDYSSGFANPSQEYISSIIKSDIGVIGRYLYLLEQQKLIKIIPQEPIYKCLDSNGNEVYEYIPNHYIVNFKLQENKYYLGD